MLKDLIENESNRFAKEFYQSLLSDGYSLSGDSRYKTSKDRVMVTCPKGHTYGVTPYKFKLGRRCVECHLENKRLHFANEFYENLKENGYVMIEGNKYVDSTTHVKVRCPNDHLYDVSPRVFNNGYRCKECLKLSKVKKFHEALQKARYTLVNGSKYEFAKKQVEVMCPNGHVYKTTPDNFMGSKNREGKRCTRCHGFHRMAHDEFKELVNKEFEGEITVIGEYVNSNTKVLVRHNSDNCDRYEWTVLPSNLVHKRQMCPKCAGNAREGIEGFKRKVRELEGDNYTVIGEYVNADTPIKIRHNNNSCNYFEWEVVPFNFTTHGTRCPACNQSRGEREISKYLIKNGIDYIPQFKFDDCKYKRPLPFDFCIFENETLICLIEFHGKQHYEPTRHFGGEHQFKVRQQRDEIKRIYCKENDIPLIEIPYWDFENIETILNKKLNEIMNKFQAIS
ncbi:hypothetical protein QNH23_06495 [Siminovitchia fortis]|uniref:DUF2726 domain-containing protein n=1 Tax=Siminovitchia fortis TaxID=254758 RepID=A0A443IM70_9BACI|nr:hypothetical protein [Siminovitchia fortis]RWR06754.1 hypothetical protein D4N35_013900 [Siminovitchia fortis]WHY83021.1 hypothetical protein QNH23_06495 [Siminovitchia fortis]